MSSLAIIRLTRLHYSLSLFIGLTICLCSHLAAAQVTAPTRGGGVSVTRITATSMELTFGSNGTGQGRVVALAATQGGKPVPLTAVDGKSYTAAPTYGQGATLGEGYVVYNGPDHSATVTGLQPNTYYYITNAEYNADSTNIAYNTRGTSMAIATRSATTSPTPLPVELTSFTGSVDDRSLATLRWTTASERNTAYFALERSSDGNSFTEVGQLTAAGNSSQALGYQWTDAKPLASTTYYRLRQADYDGTSVYSSVVAVSPSSKADRIVEVYPNPSAGQEVKVLLQGFDNELITLRLCDALGRQVLAQSFTPTDSHYFAPFSLPPGLTSGTYLLSLAGSSSTVQKRIVVSTD
jgi:hypothetical protein